MRIIFWILMSGFLALASGCGQQETASTTTTCSACATSTTTTSAVTTTTQASSQTVRISGTLASGTIAAGIRAFSSTADYKVVAIDNNTGKTYYSTTDASSNFSFDVPPTASYEISLVNNDSKYFGPVVMVGNSSSSEVVMGIKPSSDTNLGQIVVDAASGYAAPTIEPAAIANFSDLAQAAQGVPKGAGSSNVGTTKINISSTREGADMDRDGIPNLFDGDEDDDGYRNGIIRTASTRGTTSQTIEAVFHASNIWATHGSNTGNATQEISWWLQVVPKSETALTKISSVACISVPASFANVAQVRHAESLGSIEGYPQEWSLWVNSGFKLFKTIGNTFPENRYMVSLKPNATMYLGDTFTIRVYYTDGGHEDFFLSLPYVLTDWARIISYNGIPMTSSIGTRSSAEAAVISGSSLEIIVAKPRDEGGSVLSGLRYSISIGTCEAEDRLGVPTNTTRGYNATDYPNAFTDGATTETISVDRLVTLEAGRYYYITPVAESADGQRNGEEYWFKKL